MSLEHYTASDFDVLDRYLESKNKIKLADVKDRIERVAFDVVRFRDNDDLSKLWKIEQTPDGEVLVAMYDEGDESLEVTSNWSVVVDKAANINIFYKNEAITKVSASTLGMVDEDIGIISRTISKKLATDGDFVSRFLNSLSDKNEVLGRYPELGKGGA